MSVILASASAIRAELLQRAGLTITVDPARIDEDTVKQSLRGEQATPAMVAETLAELKAVAVSRRHPGALVIGADQMLDCDGTWFDKPADRAGARAQLQRLRGQTHHLIAGVCVVRDGQRLWHHNDRASLVMRRFSDEFLDNYLDAVGADACASVGGYQLEGRGVQLFSRVDGDFFTILGLPLLPLLDFLRGHEVIPT